MIAENTTSQMMELLADLPFLQRIAVLAYYYDNRSIDEIARIMECSSDIVRKCLDPAKKYLKANLSAHEEKCSCTLCSLSPAVLSFALKALLAKEVYLLPPHMAQYVYNFACSKVGLCATPIKIQNGTE